MLHQEMYDDAETDGVWAQKPEDACEFDVLERSVSDGLSKADRRGKEHVWTMSRPISGLPPQLINHL
jgi:hypothetical protein